VSEGWIAIIAATIGGLIGTVGTLVTTWLQVRRQRRSDLVKVAYDAAIIDHRTMTERAAEEVKQGKYTEVPPFLNYVFHHAGVIELVERGRLTPRRLKKLIARERALGAALREIQPPPAGWPK